MLLVNANGKKKPPFLVFKRKNADSAEQREANTANRHGFGLRLWKELEPLQAQHRVEIYGNATAWWSADLSIAFVRFHFGEREEGTVDMGCFFRALDCQSERRSSQAERHPCQGPPRYTYVCQPADISWNKPLKDRLRAAWVDLLQEQLWERTTGVPFKVVAPTRAKLTKWISQAWGDLCPTTVTSGFTKARIIENDGDRGSDEQTGLDISTALERLALEDVLSSMPEGDSGDDLESVQVDQ
jgi:hypothetical protein